MKVRAKCKVFDHNLGIVEAGTVFDIAECDIKPGGSLELVEPKKKVEEPKQLSPEPDDETEVEEAEEAPKPAKKKAGRPPKKKD